MLLSYGLSYKSIEIMNVTRISVYPFSAFCCEVFPNVSMKFGVPFMFSLLINLDWMHEVIMLYNNIHLYSPHVMNYKILTQSLNSPHNPTGKVFTKDELETIAGACCSRNCLAITDEV